MHPFRTRSIVPVAIGLFAILMAGLVMVTPAFAANTDIKINEFSSNNPDFVELINTGSAPMDLTGWVLKDNTENNSYTFPAGSSIAAGAIKGVSGEGVDFSFGLGNGDSVRLFAPGGVLVEAHDYAAHPAAGKSWGRCPDGTGAIGLTETATKGAPNACGTPDSAVKINEFSSNNPDFIELINTGGGPVNLAGWVLKDNSENNSYVFPAGASIASGEIKALNGEGADFVFGLGGADSVRLFAADGTTVVDSYTYSAHPPAGKSYGRCPAGTGDFVVTAAATKGAANECPVPAGGDNVRINEVESDPNDLVELTNVGEAPVDLSGYVIKDNDDTHVHTIAPGTVLNAHGYLVIDVNASFGLGKGDSVRLYTPGTTRLLDETTYPSGTHATTWGRCPDGTGDFVVTVPTLGTANTCGPVGPPNVKINEVESNGDKVADWVELKNLGGSAVNISGWKIVDGDPAHAATPVVVPANTTIPAGGYYAIYTEVAQSPGFGLGVGDSVTLYLADGSTQIDTTTWGAHAATTWGRCPDGTGAFGDTTTSTRGLPNACSPIRINEIESDGGTPADWIELANISDVPVDVSGWTLKDSDDAHAYVLPAGSTVPANGYRVVEGADFSFDLEPVDAVRLFDASSALIESYSWTVAAARSYGRCKDGIGDFVDTKAVTKGATNSCPGLDTQPWPGAQSVATADLAATFVQDLSGLTFDPSDPDVLWGSQNKLGTLFKLVRDNDNNWVPAAGWPKNPLYPNGAGAPDTEGIAIGPDGFVYLASERNNSASGVSRMSVLRYDPAGTGATLTATNEWDLTSKIPAAGANLGLEGVAWVPDSYLVGNGFVDPNTAALYNPATYPDHGTGLYFVAVEDTGNLHAFALNNDGTSSTLVATMSSGFAHLADVAFDPELQRVWAITDDTHDGKTSQLKIDGAGAFVVDAAFDRPAAMPNLNNEGLAIAPQSRCVGGFKEVLWSDDGDTDGHSIRRGSINCTNVALTAPAPSVSGTAKVGETLTVEAGTWGPAPVSLSYQWFAGANPIDGGTGSSLALSAAVVGETISVAVTGTKPGYSAVVKTSAPTAPVSSGTLVVATPTITGSPVMAGTLTADPGAWGPAPVTFSYQWYAEGSQIAGATDPTLVLDAAQVGATIAVEVTGTKVGYVPVSMLSASTVAVEPNGLTSAAPTVAGKAKVGSTLTVLPGTWGPAPVNLTYQWFADGVAVAGATGSTFTPTAAQARRSVLVRVTGSKTGYASKTVSSAAKKVAPGKLAATKPRIVGKPKIGKFLAVRPGAWGPARVTFRYVWKVNGKVVAAAKHQRFKVRPKFRGKRITVTVIGAKVGYYTAKKTSAPTAKAFRRR